MNNFKTKRKVCEKVKSPAAIEGHSLSRKRTRITQKKRKEMNHLNKLVGRDSVIYVGTIFPQGTSSFIDLTKSDSDLLLHPKKRSRKNKNTQVNRRHSLKNLNASLVTIQPINQLASTSSENFGLIRTNDKVYQGDYGTNSSTKMNPSKSSIQLKRTYPFTAVTGVECGQQNINEGIEIEETLLIDDIVQRINIDFGQLAMSKNETELFTLDINSLIELYRINSEDNFDLLDV